VVKYHQKEMATRPFPTYMLVMEITAMIVSRGRLFLFIKKYLQYSEKYHGN